MFKENTTEITGALEDFRKEMKGAFRTELSSLDDTDIWEDVRELDMENDMRGE